VARRSNLSDRSGRHDRAYRDAKEAGFAARAVFKLEELDHRFRLLTTGRRVLDLGCWPGSWMQYASERVGENGFVVGIDRVPLELALPSWTTSIAADVLELEPATLVQRFGSFDVVLSDMAPKTIGHRATDQYRSEALTERALLVAKSVLRPGGHFVGKVFQGGGLNDLLSTLRQAFSEARSVHVTTSRAGSSELYLVGRGLKGSRPATTTPAPLDESDD